MFLELVAAVSAAFALGGIAAALRWLSRGRLPSWLVPVAAGAGMLGFAVWNEYSWADRLSAGLPPEVPVVWRNEERAVWRPWTYVSPITTRFTAVDLRNPRRNEAAPGMVMVDVLLFARWQPPRSIPVVIDCDGKRRADPAGSTIQFDDAGRIESADWRDLPDDDPVLLAACGGGGHG
jgi:hypothetical protein